MPAERELAVSLGVSRTSVREAIISLEMSGLVEVRVGTGIFVTTRPDAARGASRDAGPGPFELLAARKLVEGEIAALAATVASVEDADALRKSVERLEASTDDFVARESEDRDFHLRLAKATGNSSLELVVEGLWDQRAELWARMQHHFHTKDLAERTIRDHAAIVAAVAAHNPGRRACGDASAPCARCPRIPARRRQVGRAARGRHCARHAGCAETQGRAAMITRDGAGRAPAQTAVQPIASTGIVPNTGGCS